MYVLYIWANVVAIPSRLNTGTGIRVVSNAGGVNPHACVTALSEAAAEQGVELSVAMVTGDELMDKVITNLINAHLYQD